MSDLFPVPVEPLMVFRIPTIEERTAIVGKTGSGKTQAGTFLLSRMPFDSIPFVILDFKRDKIFSDVNQGVVSGRSSAPLIPELSLDGKGWEAINAPGLYIVRPTIDQSDEVENLLWYIWEHEYCGIFIDEGYMIGKSRAFIACLTQGRSKNIPMITLSQRPAWITKFVFSEADYLQIFKLTLAVDKKTVQEYVDRNIQKRLPPYYSYWYDVNREELAVLRPVPGRDFIVKTIRDKLVAMRIAHGSKQFV